MKAFSELVSRVNHRGRKYLKYKPKEENICFQTICEKSKKKKQNGRGRTILMLQLKVSVLILCDLEKEQMGREGRI